jgi:hypothetical protein
MAGTTANSRSNDDEVTLIGEKLQPECRFNRSTICYLLLKGAPWIVYNGHIWPETLTVISLTIFALLVVTDVWLSSGTFSLELIGLSWSFDCGKGVTFHIEKDQYVSTIDSAVFWIGLGGNGIVSAAVSVFNVVKRRVALSCVMIVITGVQAVNLWYGYKCLMVGRMVGNETGRGESA